MRRYGSEANERWEGFELRAGDIVVSTRSKCGTTWVQMICALLVHGHPLPMPLSRLSPWLDWDIEPIEVVRARLDAQVHRRIIKTHTPLDGIPLDPGVDYVVVGRHPLDVAVSLFHHGHNIDRDRFAELTGRRTSSPPASIDEWIVGWLDPAEGPRDMLDTLPGLLHHLSDAWTRTTDQNVHLLHYRDLGDDLGGCMRVLAHTLGIDVPEATWPALVSAASFEVMRDRAAQSVPDHLGVLAAPEKFFRAGTSGEGAGILGDAVTTRCLDRVHELAEPALATWLLR